MTTLLTVSEFATATGYREGTVRNKIHKGEIPVVKLGTRTIRIRRSTLEELLRSAESTGRQQEGAL